jgi:hypothetical protein
LETTGIENSSFKTGGLKMCSLETASIKTGGLNTCSFKTVSHKSASLKTAGLETTGLQKYSGRAAVLSPAVLRLPLSMWHALITGIAPVIEGTPRDRLNTGH